MKILLLFLALVGIVALLGYLNEGNDNRGQVKPSTVTPVPNVQIIPQQEPQQYVFVPYWSFSNTIDIDHKTSLIYFGLGVDAKGILQTDRGYQQLESFVNLTQDAHERILAVRMTDKNINAAILKDKNVQKSIVSKAVTLAKQNNFDGVLLDYETSAFAFESTINNITSFHKLFSDGVRSQNLLFYVTLYGDTYHQARPFDVPEIGRMSDKVLIMAYDFSKSRGNPGPNFPLGDKEIYGYDFRQMIEDFQRDVDNKKLVVTLGYFGYDWKVDSQGSSIASGIPHSLGEIRKEYLTGCEFDDCRMTRDSVTSEPSVEYIDDEGARHKVWFEDLISAQKKKDYLKTKGIVQIAEWAYSYY